jgi:hypothetical protein
MTNTSLQPNVPQPSGAVSGDFWDYGERVIIGPARGVPGRSAIEYPDKRLNQ